MHVRSAPAVPVVSRPVDRPDTNRWTTDVCSKYRGGCARFGGLPGRIGKAVVISPFLKRLRCPSCRHRKATVITGQVVGKTGQP